MVNSSKMPAHDGNLNRTYYQSIIGIEDADVPNAPRAVAPNRNANAFRLAVYEKLGISKGDWSKAYALLGEARKKDPDWWKLFETAQGTWLKLKYPSTAVAVEERDRLGQELNHRLEELVKEGAALAVHALGRAYFLKAVRSNHDSLKQLQTYEHAHVNKVYQELADKHAGILAGDLDTDTAGQKRQLAADRDLLNHAQRAQDYILGHQKFVQKVHGGLKQKGLGKIDMAVDHAITQEEYAKSRGMLSSLLWSPTSVKRAVDRIAETRIAQLKPSASQQRRMEQAQYTAGSRGQF